MLKPGPKLEATSLTLSAALLRFSSSQWSFLHFFPPSVIVLLFDTPAGLRAVNVTLNVVKCCLDRAALGSDDEWIQGWLTVRKTPPKKKNE